MHDPVTVFGCSVEGDLQWIGFGHRFIPGMGRGAAAKREPDAKTAAGAGNTVGRSDAIQPRASKSLEILAARKTMGDEQLNRFRVSLFQ